MSKVADVDLEQLWASAAPQALQRTADLARRLVKASVSTIHVLSTDREVVRSEPAPRHSFEESRSDAGRKDAPPVSVGAPIQLSCGRHIGELRVSGSPPGSWNAEDHAILVDLAAQLANEIELRYELSRNPGTVSDDDAGARLLAVADRIPGLIFERRKLDSGQSSYRFFGAGKTRLPAVRRMMEGGIADLDFVHRDDRDGVRAAILASNLEETDLDLTFRVKELDQGIRWVRSQSIVRRDADGTVCWDGLCFDITDLVAPLENAEATLSPGATRHQVERPAVLLPATETTKDESTDPQTGARILLADDLDLNRKLIADMLSFEGYVVDCVADGAEAVQAVRLQAYDLVLMDMIMPGMDGVAATRAIRAMPRPACNVPIVALTAHSERDQLDGCLDAGMDAALTKPMSMEALTTAVAQWTRKAA